jgi:carbamoyltransferase
MIILGIGGILNDAACALLRDGELVAAVEEKKIARRYTPGEMPEQALTECLRIAKVKAEQVDCVALVRPFSESRESDLHTRLRARFPNARFLVVEHHAAHAASAYYLSPFEDAVVLTLDRSGDLICGARWKASGNELSLENELYLPDSLGELFGRVTRLLGFQPNADEHKVQWLSTYGDDRYDKVFDSLFVWTKDNWPHLNGSSFDGNRSSTGGFSDEFLAQLDLSSANKAHVASGLQHAVERAVIRMAGDTKRLCLAGGLGMNTLLVAALEKKFEVFVQPASGNAGTAIGAVAYAWNFVARESKRATLADLCLGPAYSPEEIKQVLENCKLRFRMLLTLDEAAEQAVSLLSGQSIVAWMQGRMEFGPRALGNRSILASPLNSYSTENLNTFIKHREPFRKFAASVPEELASEYFEVGPNARYLATVGHVKPAHRKTFESAVLGDGLVRVHTVSKTDNPLYYRLLHEAGKQTGLPVLYNTSFNLFSDPLVCSPRDAARSFYSSGIDAMFVGSFLLSK